MVERVATWRSPRDLNGPMPKRILIPLLIAGVAPVLGGYVYREYQRMFGPGNTMEETAHILVHDLKFGGRAKKKAIECGDPILPLIEKESEDFTQLNGRNAPWIANVLGAIRTERSRTLLLNLYSRADPIARLTGAIGLAQQSALPDPIDEDSFLVITVRTNPNQTETELAIIALGWTKDRRALPCLLDLLRERPDDYWHHALACQALARINSSDAILVLRECLAHEEFHAFPDAFRALLSLRDRDAVPLAIARVTPEIEDLNSGYVVGELKMVTGKSYGYNQARWRNWWDSVKGEWQIPGEFRKPWDQQSRMY